MKRLLSLCAVLLWFNPASLLAARAPDLAPLPDFDQRLAGLPQQPVLPADKQAAVARLKDRLPGAKISTDRLFQSPSFIIDPHGFLTAPAGQGGGALSAQALQAIPANDPHRPIKAFLNEHSALFGYDAQVLNTARVKKDYVTAHNGLQTVQWEQVLDGIPVFNSLLLGHITKNGELVNLTARLLPDPAQAADATRPNRRAIQNAPPVSAAQALVLAANNIGDPLDPAQVVELDQPAGPEKKQRFGAAPVLRHEAYAELAWLPLNNSSLTLCWKVLFTSRSRNQMFYTLVDASTGDVWVRRCLTRYISNASYRVYTSDSPSPFSPGHATPNTNQPALVQRTLVVTNAFDTNASPNGWINDNVNITQGNNVDAYLDRDANDIPDTPRTTGNPNRVFDFTLNLTQDPTNYGDASVVQLFYYCNVYHDRLYELGFTEAAGNFQMSNFNRGGFEGDPVLAEAQYGSGLGNPSYFNNAFFATPPDGQSGYMSMFLYDGATPNRDSTLDAEVVWHEHTHGLSWRLVGGGDALYNEQSDSMGEGWSDWYAMTLLSEAPDNVDGNYANGGYSSFLMVSPFPPNNIDFENYYYGDRRYPYSTDTNKNPLTFKDIDPNQAVAHTNAPLSPLWPFDPQYANEVHFAGEVWCVTLWEARANLIKKWGWATGNQLILQIVTDGMKLTPPYPNYLQARDAIIQADLVDTGGANYLELWSAFAKRGMGSSASSPGSETSIGVTEAFDMPGLTFKEAFPAGGNGNGVIDVNECNEIYVVLVNNSRSNATFVSASLSTTTPNVLLSRGDSPYPDMPWGSLATNLTPFKIYTTPAFICGSFIDFTLVITSLTEIHTNHFRMSTGLVGPSLRFNNDTPLTIPGSSPLGVDSPIVVSGLASGIAAVTVSLHLSHPIVSDLYLTLLAPDGTRVLLYAENFWFLGADFGLNCTPDSVRTTFDDKASRPVSVAYPPYVGSYRPKQSFKGLLGKSGSTVNGVWKLRITSYLPYDGTLDCWSLEISPTSCSPGGGDCSTDLAIFSSYTPAAPILNSNLNINVTVLNLGSNSARSVTLTNTLPREFTFLSATSTRGGCTVASNIVTCSIGTLSNSATANVNLTVRPTQVGIFTNIATVTSPVSDVATNNNTSILLIEIFPPRPIIVPAGTKLVSESTIPNNGGIDVDETVTINFAFKNIGALSTENLVATLLNTNGVTAASTNRSYGVLVPGGPAGTNAFTFTAAGTNGGPLAATFQLQDGTNDLGLLAFPFRLVGNYSWYNPGVIEIRDTNKARPYPSSITVAGLTNIISKVTVTISNLTHAAAEDIDVLLVGPTGKSTLLMADAGSFYRLEGVTLTFDDTDFPLPQWNVITSGAYAPTDYGATDDVFLAPAPAAPYGKTLAAFNGSDPNGAWNLYVMDDTYGGAGWINGGWELNISTVDYVDANADLAVVLADSPDPVMINSPITYTISVTNLGPDTATGVIVTNNLPASLSFASVVSSAGACTNNGSRVSCSLGTLTNGARATVTITATAVASGTISNFVRVLATEVDPNLPNNSASTLTTVNPASDLAVSMAAAPSPATVGQPLTYTITVTNLGPSTSSSLALTNILPNSNYVRFISATAPFPASCTNSSNGIVSCSLGALSPNSSFLVTVQVQPTQVGLITNFAKVSAAQPVDLVQTNNQAALITRVNNPSLILVPDGAVLLSESGPLNGGIDPNETVTVRFALRNLGVASTTNLVATLQGSGGVSPITNSQSYGVVLAGGPSVWKDFALTASGANGGTLTATLQLADGSNYLGTAIYPFVLGGGALATNRDSIIIPDHGPATVYPSRLVISNLAGVVSKVTLSLFNLNHTYPADLDMLLVAPNGTNVLFMSDAGGNSALNNVNLTFDDAASGSLPDNARIESGTYKPTNYGSAPDYFPWPAPYGTNLAALNGVNPNGAWSLYIFDDSVSDAGSLAGGWTLSISTVGRINYTSPWLSAILTNGQVLFTICGTPGATFVIEASSNLTTWTNIQNLTFTQTNSTFTDPNPANAQRRFYRARQP